MSARHRAGRRAVQPAVGHAGVLADLPLVEGGQEAELLAAQRLPDVRDAALVDYRQRSGPIIKYPGFKKMQPIHSFIAHCLHFRYSRPSRRTDLDVLSSSAATHEAAACRPTGARRASTRSITDKITGTCMTTQSQFVSVSSNGISFLKILFPKMHVSYVMFAQSGVHCTNNIEL